MRSSPSVLRRGFSLIEVIAAVAIFALGMVAILALFAPVTRSVANSSDAEAAARMADAVRARLQALPFAQAAALIQDATAVAKNDADGSYNPNDGTKHPAVIFGKVTGEVSFYNATGSPKGWYDYDYSGTQPQVKLLADADKYYEIELIRNATLSPKANDGTAALLAFNLRIRWPAFLPASNGPAVQVGAGGTGSVTFDAGKQQVLFFTGFITR